MYPAKINPKEYELVFKSSQRSLKMIEGIKQTENSVINRLFGDKHNNEYFGSNGTLFRKEKILRTIKLTSYLLVWSFMQLLWFSFSASF